MVMYQRDGKIQPADLVIGFDGDRDVIVEKTYVSEFAWSPDGRKIAIATSSELLFFDMSNMSQQIVTYVEKDDRLFAHAARKIQWNPTGDKVSCRINFLGGRIGSTSIFGDHQVFLISTDGDFKYFNQDEAKDHIKWYQD